MDIGEVDWKRLAAALDWYEGAGFRRISLPWHARREVIEVTCPAPERQYALPGVGTLVGSAEQSFMQMQFDGLLPKGRWVSLTPCFRAEPVFDDLHHPYFMKVELYSNEDTQEALDIELAETARRFMRLHGAREVDVVRTYIGYDLEIGGVEVGSYSTREHNGHVWTCGTGLAEPRFSQAVGIESL
ncbi:MAG: hypothetical protein EOR63_32315 [Mesorhizobium sp.]|nr:MAG: hypothetical protein EOR63_32315 [Mesorhizobium sp.]